MATYIPKITEQGGEYYALIVRVDLDGEENVIHGYKGRYFKTRKAAIKSTDKYIETNELNGVAEL